MDVLEQHFINNCKYRENLAAIEILNWYRNFYHAEDVGTERRIMAEAINTLFMELI
jgi:hypothetical protein